MDFVDRLTGRSRAQAFDTSALFKLTDLSAPVQKHLAKVYTTLAAALVVATLGVVFNILTGIGGILSILGFVGCSVWLMSVNPIPSQLNKRYALGGGAAFCQGCSLGPLIGAVLQVHPGILLTAFLGTAAVFACFSAAALISRRRSYLFLGGSLSSAISLFMVMRLASWMFGAREMVFQAELYLGLMVFVGYVLFDTQLIVEKAYAGETDHIKQALDLFVDFMAIFVRLLIILLQNAEKKQEKSRKKRKD